MAIWVSIFHLPLEFHSPEFLIAIDNALGRTVALDGRNRDHAYKVRIYTEVDLKSLTPQHIQVNQSQCQILFENSHIFSELISSAVNFPTVHCSSLNPLWKLISSKGRKFEISKSNETTVTSNHNSSLDQIKQSNQPKLNNKNLLPHTKIIKITSHQLNTLLTSNYQPLEINMKNKTLQTHHYHLHIL